METITDNFSDVPVLLDGKRFTGCTFERCTLAWGGGDYIIDETCTVVACTGILSPAIDRVIRGVLMFHRMGLIDVTAFGPGTHGADARDVPTGGWSVN